MSMPKIPDMNPEININRKDAINLIIMSTAMEELSIAHILNAEGEKLQYVLGTLEEKDPGEITVCDIMAVNKSIQKTLRDAIKAEMLLQLKLEDALEMDDTGDKQLVIDIKGQKTWVDNHNAESYRPPSIAVRLLQNGAAIKTIAVLSPPDSEDTVAFSFLKMPVADSQGVPYVYAIEEDDIENYEKTVDGFHITNTLKLIPFSFTKNRIRTGMVLQGAEFEIRKNEALIGTAVSDENGIVSFLIPSQGTFQMAETRSPAGFMSNITVYEVVVASNGTVTVDGLPASEFHIENQPVSYSILIDRATKVLPSYMSAPNTWSLHGTIPSDLFMMDKILITLPVVPVTVKWDHGIKDVDHFSTGGNDITGSYTDGIPTETNGDYTVYALFDNGYETTATINLDCIRDGSVEMPYLLIDFTTAADSEPAVTGIGQFTLNYMQGGGIKLAQNYELYEDIDMSEKIWTPLGIVDVSDYPIIVTEGFSGSLEGNGHTITGLDLRDTNGSDIVYGLFSVVIDGAVVQNFGISYNIECFGYVGMTAVISISDGGTVLFKNLRINDSTISNNGNAGSIAGYAFVSNGSLNIDECSSVNLEINNSVSGAGIIGAVYPTETGTISITNCSSYGSINNMTTAGGIVAAVNNPSMCSIKNCVSGMSLNGQLELGGIVGIVNARSETGNFLTISSCYNYGKITGSNYCGGIIGSVNGQNTSGDVIIENCYNTGTINKKASLGVTTAGGLLGQASDTITLRSSYNVGDVTGETSTGTARIGGISSNYGSIQNCAAINSETSSPQLTVARISPSNSGSGALNNNVAFDNMQVLTNGVQKSPLDIGSSGVDGINANTAKIKTQALYENDLGWDFDDVWSFGNGTYTLPILREIPLDLQPNTLPTHLA